MYHLFAYVLMNADKINKWATRVTLYTVAQTEILNTVETALCRVWRKARDEAVTPESVYRKCEPALCNHGNANLLLMCAEI